MRGKGEEEGGRGKGGFATIVKLDRVTKFDICVKDQ